MNKIEKVFIVIILVSAFTLNRTSAQSKSDLIGYWDSYIPLAPPEYQKSTVRITQDTVFMSMDGVHFAPANFMAFKNDTLNYGMNEASFKLVFESSVKMRGIAKWAAGQSELILTKRENSDSGSTFKKP